MGIKRFSRGERTRYSGAQLIGVRQHWRPAQLNSFGNPGSAQRGEPRERIVRRRGLSGGGATARARVLWLSSGQCADGGMVLCLDAVSNVPVNAPSGYLWTAH